MHDVEEIYDNTSTTTESTITTTPETRVTVDPLSRVPSVVEDCSTTDDIISVQIDTD